MLNFSIKGKKVMVATSLSILLLAGCSTSTGNGIIVDPNEISSSVSTSIGELNFSKISEKNTQLLNSTAGSSGTAQNSADVAEGSGAVSAPVAAPAATPAIAEDSRMIAEPYPIGFPAPGYFEQYVVVDTSEAKTKGYTGTYLETVKNIIQPIVSTLGSDARLVSSNGSTDNAGLNKPAAAEADKEKSIYSPYKWYFSFTSKSKLEAYNIYVSTDETLVIRQKWGLLNLNLNEVKIDSNKALEILKNAIKDKDYTPPEPQEDYRDPNTVREIMYEVPENSTWYFYLNQEKKDLVWNINLNYNYYRADDVVVMEAVDSAASTGTNSTTVERVNVWYSNAYARINANTGEIISLNRPMKYTYTYTTRPKTEPGIEEPPLPPEKSVDAEVVQ